MMMKMAHPRSCGELREAGTIGQIQLAMLTPVGSYSAKDKTGEEMIQEFFGTNVVARFLC